MKSKRRRKRRRCVNGRMAVAAVMVVMKVLVAMVAGAD